MSDHVSDSSDLRTILTDSVEGLLADLVTRELLAAAETGTWPADLWRKIEDQGLTLALVGEAGGGVAAGWHDVYPVVRAAGRHAAPVPLAETIVAAFLLDRAGLKVPEGPLTIAVPRAGESLQLRRNGSRWQLSGVASRVPWGIRCRHAVVVSRDPEGVRVALVDTGKAQAEAGQNIAREPRDTLRFAAAEPDAVGDAESNISADAPLFLGAMVRAAQIAGGLDKILETTVEYAGTRVQFGRPIGKYQAIQFQLAAAAGQSAASGLAAEVAFRAAGLQDDARFEIACAKARASEAAQMGTSVGHQTHGAIAFTYDHTLHFSTKRVWSWRAEYGSAGYWQRWIGDLFTSPGAPPLWSYLTAR
jgi:acyl-CoA dehydrogenase